MPRFFTHVLNDTGFTPDEEGRDFPDVAAAQSNARRTLGEIIAEELALGREEITLTAMIDDAQKVRVCDLRAAARLVISGSPLAGSGRRSSPAE